VKILLTGPTGFIGKTFIRHALGPGHEIAGLIIPSESIPAEFTGSPANLHWLRGTLDEAPWKEIEDFAPEVCVHMAWITTPGVYLESPENESFRDVSLRFICKLQDIRGGGGGRGRGGPYVLALGTCIEYEPSDQPLSEDRSPIAPTTLYSRCKNELRIALEGEAKSRGFGFSWARVFYPYGPGEHPSRLCSSIIQKLARNEKIVLKTPNSTKDYIYITDLAAALLTVLEKKFAGTINLGTGTAMSVKEIAQTIAQEMGKEHLVEAASQSDPDPLPYVVADASKLKSLGWNPELTMDAGLKEMVKLVGEA
jgi:nucleoside-diphosphate-sugar epimerase